MKFDKTLLILGIFLSIFLVACATTPGGPSGPSASSGTPSAPSAGAGASAGAQAPAAPVSPEAKFKITKQAALRNPSRVMATIANIGTIDSSIELNVSLIYARKVVASKTVTASINMNESKDITVEFPETTTFVSYSIEGAGLENPVKPLPSITS